MIWRLLHKFLCVCDAPTEIKQKYVIRECGDVDDL